jgi:ArsR family transcriptional regulator
MNRTAHIFKALSDETRLRIMGLLLEGELCVCDLMAVLELPQSTTSRHLAYLRNAGLVSDRRQGVWMKYRLADDPGGTANKSGCAANKRGGAANDTDAGHGLRSDLLHLLENNLAELPQAREDRRRLSAYLAGKRKAAC